MIWGAVIVAAGRGTRFGRPKQFVEIAGRPMVAWSIAAFASMPEVSDVVVVTEADQLAEMTALAERYAAPAALRVVAGGADRQASAANGVHGVPEHCNGILIHDGARPLVRHAEIRAGMRAVSEGVAALLAAPVIDTIKVADAHGKVVRTLERDMLWAAQTPQFATAREMRRAHADAVRHDWPRATDDAALLERAGLDVMVVASPAENFKVTLPADLERAELLLAARELPVEDEEEVLLLECYVPPYAVDAVLAELDTRTARVDGIDRDLPEAVAIRAYASPDALRGFGFRLHALAGERAAFTTRLSHVGPRTGPRARHLP